jgi:hypothetical protein
MGAHLECLRAVLRERPVLFAHELCALTGLAEAEVDRLLDRCQVVVRSYPAPDRHVPGPLRVVSHIADGDAAAAAQRAERFWSTWLRSFLQTHSCM